MAETGRDTAVDETRALAGAYLHERVTPHPLLAPYLEEAAVWVTGSLAFGVWDEQSDLDLRLALPDEEQGRLARELRRARLWDPARDFRLRLDDREPFRRLPGVQIQVLSASELERELRFDLPVGLWVHTHNHVFQDPAGLLENRVGMARREFDEQLPTLRCEHYYLFRQARSDLSPRIMPRRASTLLAMKRGDTVREALRLAFLADGLPYPYDKWLEAMAERETHAGAGIVTAVRALVSAREAQTLDHASKVLRDRVAFALQQGGVSEPWLEQWWLWPSLA